jgi:hypothetical protein
MIIDNDRQQPQGGPQAAAGSRRRPQAVLVACEVTQSVTAAFRRRGIAAWSCDILPTMGLPQGWAAARLGCRKAGLAKRSCEAFSSMI